MHIEFRFIGTSRIRTPHHSHQEQSVSFIEFLDINPLYLGPRVNHHLKSIIGGLVAAKLVCARIDRASCISPLPYTAERASTR